MELETAKGTGVDTDFSGRGADIGFFCHFEVFLFTLMNQVHSRNLTLLIRSSRASSEHLLPVEVVAVGGRASSDTKR